MVRGGGGGVAPKSTVVVLDNGGALCKAGVATETSPSVVVPNFLARPRSSKKWLSGDQLSEVSDIQALSIRRPMDRGYLLNPDLQREIWERLFKTHLKLRPSECSLLLVEPLFNFPSVQKATDEILFEDFGFQSLYIGNAPALSHIYQAKCAPESLLAKSNCSLVIDSGFSFTHAVPIFDGFVVSHAVRRMNLGGKALTNHLKELVSYRSLNMMDETYIMDDVKEKLCFCSLDTIRDLGVARQRGQNNYFRCDYILPDGVKYKRGFIKDPKAVSAYLSKRQKKDLNGKEEESQGSGEADPEVKKAVNSGMPSKDEDQILTLTNERFLIPEMLFHPVDLGMNEAGLADCIVQAIKACHPDLYPILYSNILLTGGCTLFQGFKERLEAELRPLVPDELNVAVHTVDNPLLAPWRGGALLGRSPNFHTSAITKREYEEQGSLRCRHRFML